MKVYEVRSILIFTPILISLFQYSYQSSERLSIGKLFNLGEVFYLFVIKYNQYMKRIILLFVLSFLFTAGLQAQNTTNSNQSVKITTNVRPIPSLAEQVVQIEKQIEWVRAQPELVEDGTLAKWEKALAEKKKALAAEEAERRKIEAQKAKK
jgi:hypothetical protein